MFTWHPLKNSPCLEAACLFGYAYLSIVTQRPLIQHGAPGELCHTVPPCLSLNYFYQISPFLRRETPPRQASARSITCTGMQKVCPYAWEKEESNSRVGGCGNCRQGQGGEKWGMGSDLRVGSVCRELIFSNLKFFSFVILFPP